MGRRKKDDIIGNDYEKVYKRFYPSDINNIPVKSVFNDKWIVLKNLGKRGKTWTYSVCNKKLLKFGTLYIEIGDDSMTHLAVLIDFLHKQYAQSYSHRFGNILDCEVINNHLVYMVIYNRPGPTLESLLNCLKTEETPDDEVIVNPLTTAFFGKDLLQTIELLVCTGHVLRTFDPKQWKFDVKSRTFYLADPIDVVPMTDKRYAVVKNMPNYIGHDLRWHGDFKYAPISYLENQYDHRMDEHDMIEMSIYVLFHMSRGKLPWIGTTDKEAIIKMKEEFMTTLPYLNQLAVHSDGTKWLDLTLRNIIEHLKLADCDVAKYEKLPVRDGAWCPNGARAGAMISAMNYTATDEDFRKILENGQTVLKMNWREVELQWEKKYEHDEKSIPLLQYNQLRCHFKDQKRRKARLVAKNVHYQIVGEHTAAEQELNKVAIERYLTEPPETLEEVKSSKSKRRTRSSIKEPKSEDNTEEDEDVKVEKKVLRRSTRMTRKSSG